MKTAVVILNWNGRKFLERFLPSVVRFTDEPDTEIIVADNGSEDDSTEFLTRRYPEIRQIRLGRNYGFAEGYNRALAQVEAEYFVLLNSDVEVTEGWLRPLVRLLDERPDAAAAMPKIRSRADPGRFEYAGAAGGYIVMLGYPFCRGRVLNVTEEDRGQYDDRREIFWATGACMAIRSRLFREYGGFDGDFFAHQEEIDLCWRLKQAGHRIFAEPASTVYHLGGGTLPAETPRKVFLNFRNNLSMLYKNLSSRSLYPVLLFRMGLDGLAALRYRADGQKELYRSVIRAHREFRRALPTLKQKRREVQARRTGRPDSVYRGSILLRYLLGKRTAPDVKGTNRN